MAFDSAGVPLKSTDNNAFVFGVIAEGKSHSERFNETGSNEVKRSLFLCNKNGEIDPPQFMGVVRISVLCNSNAMQTACKAVVALLNVIANFLQ